MWFGATRCGSGVLSTLWSGTSLGVSGVVRVCVYVCVEVLRWVLMYRCCFFFPFVSFFVRGSGLSTFFHVTSLYIDAALLGGGRPYLNVNAGCLTIIKKKKKKKLDYKKAGPFPINKVVGKHAVPV